MPWRTAIWGTAWMEWLLIVALGVWVLRLSQRVEQLEQYNRKSPQKPAFAPAPEQSSPPPAPPAAPTPAPIQTGSNAPKSPAPLAPPSTQSRPPQPGTQHPPS